jgi:hypothetical protein
MADQMRTCRRTGCRWPAAATLAYRYATREVWLLDLVDRPDPNRWDLCPHHANNLTAPRGWDRVDQRTDQPAPVEPAGRELAAGSSPAPPDERESRYAALAARLPELAAELAETGTPGKPGGAAPVPSRDLAPLPPPEPVSVRPAPAGADELDGQLAIPVTDECATDDAVVVSIEMAGTRRGRPAGDGESLNR